MPHLTAADGIRLHYEDDGEDKGKGPPLVLLPGLTRDHRDFDYLLPHLRGRRVIRPDYRGRGRSDHADPATYQVPNEAKDVVALLDHLSLDRVALIGTSRGGLISMVLAATVPGRLAGICLNDVGPALDPKGLAKIAGYLGRAPKFATRAEMVAAMPGLNPEFEDVPPARWAEEVERHTTETDRGLGLTYDPKLRDAVLPVFEAPQPDLWPLFDRMADLPLCLIRGANSDLLPKETAAEMRRRRPDMIYAEVPGRGHIPFLDEPESLYAITAWLDLIP